MYNHACRWFYNHHSYILKLSMHILLFLICLQRMNTNLTVTQFNLHYGGPQCTIENLAVKAESNDEYEEGLFYCGHHLPWSLFLPAIWYKVEFHTFYTSNSYFKMLYQKADQVSFQVFILNLLLCYFWTFDQRICAWLCFRLKPKLSIETGTICKKSVVILFFYLIFSISPQNYTA